MKYRELNGTSPIRWHRSTSIRGALKRLPKREQELFSLKRDYENILATHNSLLARKLEAEIAVNMERKQKGEQFRVLDSARLPEKPVKPDMKKLFALIVGAGLAVGGGIIFLLEYMDNSLKRPEEIEADLELPLLCMIPEIISRKTRFLRSIEHVCCAFFAFVALTLFAGFTTLYLKGVDQTLDALKNWVLIKAVEKQGGDGKDPHSIEQI
jgi:hypothetical protein